MLKPTADERGCLRGWVASYSSVIAYPTHRRLSRWLLMLQSTTDKLETEKWVASWVGRLMSDESRSVGWRVGEWLPFVVVMVVFDFVQRRSFRCQSVSRSMQLILFRCCYSALSCVVTAATTDALPENYIAPEVYIPEGILKCS